MIDLLGKGLVIDLPLGPATVVLRDSVGGTADPIPAIAYGPERVVVVSREFSLAEQLEGVSDALGSLMAADLRDLGQITPEAFAAASGHVMAQLTRWMLEARIAVDMPAPFVSGSAYLH